MSTAYASLVYSQGVHVLKQQVTQICIADLQLTRASRSKAFI